METATKLKAKCTSPTKTPPSAASTNTTKTTTDTTETATTVPKISKPTKENASEKPLSKSAKIKSADSSTNRQNKSKRKNRSRKLKQKGKSTNSSNQGGKKIEAKKILPERKLPSWYLDSKFGIIVHFGLFSVPGFAERRFSHEMESTKKYDRSYNAEGYFHAMQILNSGTQAFHHRAYGFGYKYDMFTKPFNDCLKQTWDPHSWVDLFALSGARYVLLVAKHLDGFCLWPTQYNNPKKHYAWHTRRDVVGELATAVRNKGLRFGIIYSGGIDWAFKYDRIWPMRTCPTGRDYVMYVHKQCRELISRYRPSLLWNLIAWPPSCSKPYQSNELLKYYYKNVKDGVANNQWGTVERFSHKQSDIGDVKTNYLNPPMMEMKKSKTTPNDRRIKEHNAIIGQSQGFNQFEHVDDMLSTSQLIQNLIKQVSTGSNMVLSVGPRGVDGRIPANTETILLQMGKWLSVNHDAIYGAQALALNVESPKSKKINEIKSTVIIEQTSYSNEVMFTQRVNKAIYAILTPTQVTPSFFTSDLICIKLFGVTVPSGTSEVHILYPRDVENPSATEKKNMQKTNKNSSATYACSCESFHQENCEEALPKEDKKKSGLNVQIPVLIFQQIQALWRKDDDEEEVQQYVPYTLILPWGSDISHA